MLTLNSLSELDQEQIHHWIEEYSFREALKRAQRERPDGGFGIRTSLGSLHRFHAGKNAEVFTDLAEAVDELSRENQENTPPPSPVFIEKLLHTRLAAAALDPDTTPKNLERLASTYLGFKRLELQQQRLALQQEAQAQRAATGITPASLTACAQGLMQDLATHPSLPNRNLNPNLNPPSSHHSHSSEPPTPSPSGTLNSEISTPHSPTVPPQVEHFCSKTPMNPECSTPEGEGEFSGETPSSSSQFSARILPRQAAILAVLFDRLEFLISPVGRVPLPGVPFNLAALQPTLFLYKAFHATVIAERRQCLAEAKMRLNPDNPYEEELTFEQRKANALARLGVTTLPPKYVPPPGPVTGNFTFDNAEQTSEPTQLP